MPDNGYDYMMRCLVEGEPITAHRHKKGDYFGWYEGEVVTLHVEHTNHVLDIRLDEHGNLSLKRSVK